MLVLTQSERNFIADIIKDLAALADPSEYLGEEVDQAIEILELLEVIPTTKYLEIMENIE